MSRGGANRRRSRPPVQMRSAAEKNDRKLMNGLTTNEHTRKGNK